jgi:hypothetical protein
VPDDFRTAGKADFGKKICQPVSWHEIAIFVRM